MSPITEIYFCFAQYTMFKTMSLGSAILDTIMWTIMWTVVNTVVGVLVGWIFMRSLQAWFCRDRTKPILPRSEIVFDAASLE